MNHDTASTWVPVRMAEVELASGASGPPLTLDVDTFLLATLHGAPVGTMMVTSSQPRLQNSSRSTTPVARSRAAMVEALVNPVLAHLARDAAERPPAATGDRISDLLNRECQCAAAPFEPTGADSSAHDATRLGRAPTMTIAVCTRDRVAGLESCLRALCALATAGVDLLVVDNAPATDATERLVRERFPEVRYVREPSAGLNRARNRAIAEATGDLIAFTDDDACVAPGWAVALRALFARNPELDVATGLVLPLELETEAQWLFERYGGFGRGFRRRWTTASASGQRAIAFEHGNTGILGTGANMAFRRSVFGRTGRFDPTLDVGTETSGGGDLELFFRALKEGCMLAYEPAAIVRHQHRRSYGELQTQIGSWGSGMSAFLSRSAEHYADERMAIMRLRAWLLASWFARRLLFSFVRQPFPRDLIVRELRGTFEGPARYRRSRADAVARGDAMPIAPPAGHTAPAPHKGTDPVVERTLELCDAPTPLAGFGSATRATVRVLERGRFLGEINLDVRGGVIGADRLRDTIAAKLPEALLGASAPEARRRIATMLAERFA